MKNIDRTRTSNNNEKKAKKFQEEIYPDGSVYEGDLVNGERHGSGIFKFPKDNPQNRLSYEGKWKNDKMCGHGIMMYNDGIIFEGEFNDNDLSGYGTVIYPDGSKYVGEVKDEKQHGKGICTWPDGTFYEGEWKDDKMDGKGIITFNGIKDEGVWKDGEILYLDRWGPMSLREM